MTFYSDMQEMATELIDEFSEADIVGRRIEPPTVVSGVDVPGSTAPLSFAGVITTYTASQVNNTTILTGDILILVKSSYDPRLGDEYDIDGKTYKAVFDNPIKPSVTSIANRVQARL